MPRLALKVTLTGPVGAFAGIRKRVARPTAGRARPGIVRAMKDSVRRDFARSGHHSPSGFRPWKKTHAFGSCEPAARILGGTSGGMARAWKDAREIPSRNSVTLIASHPGMRAHRSGATVKARKRTASGRLSMVVFLGLKCGVWLSEDKALAGLKIPARPFADRNQRLAREIEEAVVEAILGR